MITESEPKSQKTGREYFSTLEYRQCGRDEWRIYLVRWQVLLRLILDSLPGTVLTSAIDTVVSGTGAGHRRQFLRKGLPGAVESDGRIVGGHAPGAGKGLNGFSGQINLLSCCTVLGLQVVDNFPNACTV